MPKIKKYLVYSTSSCLYCDLLKKWLDDNKINYESIIYLKIQKEDKK